MQINKILKYSEKENEQDRYVGSSRDFKWCKQCVNTSWLKSLLIPSLISASSFWQLLKALSVKCLYVLNVSLVNSIEISTSMSCSSYNGICLSLTSSKRSMLVFAFSISSFHSLTSSSKQAPIRLCALMEVSWLMHIPSRFSREISCALQPPCWRIIVLRRRNADDFVRVEIRQRLPGQFD